MKRTRAGEMVPWLRAQAALQEDGVQFELHRWHFRATCNSISWLFDYPLWCQWAQNMKMLHRQT